MRLRQRLPRPATRRTRRWPCPAWAYAVPGKTNWNTIIKKILRWDRFLYLLYYIFKTFPIAYNKLPGFPRCAELFFGGLVKRLPRPACAACGNATQRAKSKGREVSTQLLQKHKTQYLKKFFFFINSVFNFKFLQFYLKYGIFIFIFKLKVLVMCCLPCLAMRPGQASRGWRPIFFFNN